jgi:hypothetical protein
MAVQTVTAGRRVAHGAVGRGRRRRAEGSGARAEEEEGGVEGSEWPDRSELPGWSPIDEEEPEGDPTKIDSGFVQMLEEAHAHEWAFGIGAPGGTSNPHPSDVNTEELQMLQGREPDPDDTNLVGSASVLLAGFRAEEAPRVRLLLDELGGSDVPVIPLTQHLLPLPCRHAMMRASEPDWSQPRPSWLTGGGDGSERCILFAGLDAGERAEIVSQLERLGLPRFASTVIYQNDLDRSVGNLLADALQVHRHYERSIRQQRAASRNSAAPATPYSISGSQYRANTTSEDTPREATKPWRR